MHQGRVVLITGAGGEIGSKIVDRFLLNGDTVIGLDRSKTSLRALVKGRQRKPKLSVVRSDVTLVSDVETSTKYMRDNHGRIDVLVNCAGYYPVVPFDQMTLAQWQEVIGINLTGTFQMIRALLPLMKGCGWGRILNTSSASIFEGVVGQAHYVAAKAGLVGFTRSLAMEIGRYGITANTVAPGLTLTEPVRENIPAELVNVQKSLRAIKRNEWWRKLEPSAPRRRSLVYPPLQSAAL